jgi:hypothetical protein
MILFILELTRLLIEVRMAVKAIRVRDDCWNGVDPPRR